MSIKNPINEKEQKFVNALYIPENQGFKPEIIHTQAYLETGNFSAMPNLNYWGIKVKKGHWERGEVKDTFEYEVKDGIYTKIKIKDGFALFSSEFQAMTFYCFWIRHNYKHCYDNRKDYKEYYKGLVLGGWSTSPLYASELTKLYERLYGEK